MTVGRVPVPHVAYHRTGEYDSASDITVQPDGRYRAQSLSFVSNGFRDGRLSRADCRELVRLADALGTPQRFGFYDRLSGVSDLTVDGRLYMWPHYPPTPEIEALVAFLNRF